MYLISYCIYIVSIGQMYLLKFILKSYKCIYFQFNVNFIVFIKWMLILYMYSLKLYLLMSLSDQVYIVPRYTELTFILFTNKIYCPRACYVMLWPALPWRGQE